MTDELIILSSLDQSLPIDTDWILNKVETIINESLEKKDAEIALVACEQLIKISGLSGVGLAKMLYLLETNWYKYERDDEFDEVAYVRFGKHKHTVGRYLAVYKELFAKDNIPEQYKKDIQQQPIRQLDYIAAALKQGEELDTNDWEKLAHAPDINTVLKVLREDVRGKPPRKGSLQLFMDDLGSLWATFEKDRFFVGSLEVDNEEEAVQKAIERIKKGAGIL
jgi:Asp-tRNA(Asn)/Glu-tRNA(Gln) amidotransferase C subunit